ncbi:NADH-quinone oxidoreductase subunit C [Desulfogranum mediterraneum]|uniref:NADH-quinone oxidoreductase subunit C n=1 Tax=Desulfogranum mediterraneum TaxID=160661 RepID=UPI001E6488FF|nr:NADH-quinone oxidoreductase subunit C [Desulfogranum mediterraneum]
MATTEYSRQGYHLEVLCEPGQLVAVAEILDRQRFFIESIAGVDWPKQEQLEVVYDFTTYEAEPCRVAVRTVVPRTAPLVPTISGVFSGADWHERETFDFYGIIFDGHPDLSRILLPEDADFHPLLKDYMP